MSKKDYSRRHLSTDKYETDPWILAMYPPKYWYDPCPIDWTPDQPSGLDIIWSHEMHIDDIGIFVNPPYSNPLPWVKKAIVENRFHNETIVMLLKHDSSTKWFAALQEAGAKFLFVNGRLKYGTNRGAAFPSVLAILP